MNRLEGSSAAATAATSAGLSAAQVADEFGRAAKLLAARFDERLGEHGVSTPRSKVLVEVLRLGPVRVTDLADAIGIAQGTASVLVDALVRDQLVERGSDPHDRRAVLLSVTEQGRRRAQAWLRGYEQAAQELFAALPREQWPDLVRMMRTLSNLDAAGG